MRRKPLGNSLMSARNVDWEPKDMTASFVEKPSVAQTEPIPNSRRRKPKKKPPGTRFLLYIGFAAGLLAVQGVWLLPLKSFTAQAPQAVAERPLVPPPLVL